jgi:phosphoglycolate phosphatase
VSAYEHVIFDLDGTLVDSRLDLSAAVNHVLRSFGLPELPVPAICRYVGEGARVLVQRALGSAHQEYVEEGLEEFLVYYGAHLLDHTLPYAGIPELVTALRARGILLSVLTNKPTAFSRAILEGVHLLAHLSAVVGGDALPARKPDPVGVDHILATTGAARTRTLLVGDSMIDVHTARAAQVAFCGVAWGLRADDLRAAGVAPIIAEPMELLAVVE